MIAEQGGRRGVIVGTFGELQELLRSVWGLQPSSSDWGERLPVAAAELTDAFWAASLTQAAPNSPVLIVYSTGPDQQANGANAGAADSIFQAGERMSTFDDLLIWVGRPILLNRMISAGRLP